MQVRNLEEARRAANLTGLRTEEIIKASRFAHTIVHRNRLEQELETAIAAKDFEHMFAIWWHAGVDTYIEERVGYAILALAIETNDIKMMKSVYKFSSGNVKIIAVHAIVKATPEP